jgi:hypothetical protein
MKRTYGTGSVFQSGNRWVAQARTNDGRLKTKRCLTYEEADRVAIEMSAQYRQIPDLSIPTPAPVKDQLFAETFWSRLAIVGECWEWQGPRDAKGYGRLSGKECTISAHRMAYILAYGPIADHFIVRHTCDNPPCCNPAHLIHGTQKDNMHDAAKRGRLGKPILTKAQVTTIRKRLRDRTTNISALALEYGVSKRTIQRAAK